MIVCSSSSEQPTEVYLCHLIWNQVTTVPLGILPVMVMAVDVVNDVVLERTAADGTEREKNEIIVNTALIFGGCIFANNCFKSVIKKTL